MVSAFSTYFDQEYIKGAAINPMEALVETVFNCLLQLPHSPDKVVYYTTIFVDLVKASMETIPPLLGRSIRVIMSRMDASMDVDCIKRFGDWLAQHLSNFGFFWKWSDW